MDTKKSTMATPTLETFANQTQIFASVWSLINSQFGGEDSLERAEVERGILLDMARRLIEDHDAARLEIASLKAQLATVSVGGVGSLVSVPPECPHLIWYADQDRKPEMFVGHGARDTAMKRFHMISQHWNANLFVRIKKSSRDCPYPVADLAPAPAQAVPAPGVPRDAVRSVYSRSMDLVRTFWQQHTQADALSMTMAELHTDVELVIRAARGAAQAALKHPKKDFSEVDSLLSWFNENDGFSQGTRAPHKWVLQTHAELIRLREALAAQKEAND